MRGRVIKALQYFTAFNCSTQVAIWDVYLDDLEISEYMKMAGLMWPKHQKLISAHYSMDQMAGTVLWDSSGNEHNGTIVNAKWVKVSDSQTIRFCSVP